MDGRRMHRSDLHLAVLPVAASSRHGLPATGESANSRAFMQRMAGGSVDHPPDGQMMMTSSLLCCPYRLAALWHARPAAGGLWQPLAGPGADSASRLHLQCRPVLHLRGSAALAFRGAGSGALMLLVLPASVYAHGSKPHQLAFIVPCHTEPAMALGVHFQR